MEHIDYFLANYGYFAIALLVVATYYLVFILGWIRILGTWGIPVPYRAALQPPEAG